MWVEFTREELQDISRSLSRSVTQFLKMGVAPDKVTNLVKTHDYVNRLLEGDDG